MNDETSADDKHSGRVLESGLQPDLAENPAEALIRNPCAIEFVSGAGFIR
jgi:hypothetical protein